MTIGNMINTVLLIGVLSILTIDYFGKMQLRADQTRLVQETLNSFK